MVKDSSNRKRQSIRKSRGVSKRPVLSRSNPTPTVPNINSNKKIIGQLGEKKFGNIWYKGIITKKTNDDPVWYKIKYEDGDSEDLDLPEIEEVIQNYKNNHEGEKQDLSINIPTIITDISQLLKINNNTKDLTTTQRGYNNGVINKFFIFYKRIVLDRETITPALIEQFDEFMTPYKGRINGVLTIEELRKKGYYYFGYYKTNDLITKAVTQVHNKIEEFNTINSTDTRLLTIETDLYNVFLENTLMPSDRNPVGIINYYSRMSDRYFNTYNKTYDPEYLYIRDQIRWYVMYRQTFIIDSIHDFSKNPLIYVLIDQYRIEINNLLSEINQQTGGYSFDTYDIFIDTDEEASVYTDYKGASEDESITTEILQGNYTNKRLLSKINPTEHMKNILNDINLLITGTSTLNLKKISGIESVIAFNSGLTNKEVKNPDLKFVYGLDALSKRFKYPSTLNFLDRLGKKTWNKLYKVQSLADKYDAGSSKSKSFVKSRIVNLENNLIFKEFFNFHLGINKEYKHNLLDYSLTKKGEKVELNLKKFSTSEGNWLNTDSKKNYVESLLVTGDSSANIQAKFMYKLLGDDSKSSVLYGIFTNQIKIPGVEIFTTNYISNDITSAMKASIKLPGGLVISSAADPFVDETKLSNVEFFSQREWLPQWLLEQRVSNFFESGDIATFEEINENPFFFGKRIRSKNNKMPPKKNNKNKKFIQSALTKMRKRGTLGSFKKWCIRHKLISASGKITEKCINLAKKSKSLKIRRKAIFSQNIKAYQGARKGFKRTRKNTMGKKGRKTSRTSRTIPKSLKKLAKKYSVRLTTKRGYKSVQQIKKQIKMRMRK